MNNLAIVYGRSTLGFDSPLITIEVDLNRGLPSLTIVGLPETAVKESKERVRSAILNSGFNFPTKRITINLAPANLPKKEGGRFDLAIAIGILVASKQLTIPNLTEYEFIGELALNGDLRGDSGLLPLALATQKAKRSLIIPEEKHQEITFIPDLKAFMAHNLLSVCNHFTNGIPLQPLPYRSLSEIQTLSKLDFCEVQGQETAKRALEIVAAGGHNLLMFGPPGVGKTMLAHRLVTILPELPIEQFLETAKIYALANCPYPSLNQPPFRSPHHNASLNALVGGGNPPKPGEISLAHQGVLFLDELLEFQRSALEALREPLEARSITIARAAHKVQFPANFQLLAAMNPCPCGYAGDPKHQCTCSATQIKRYLSKLSAPLLDRIDLWISLTSTSKALSFTIPTSSTSSQAIKKRVIEAQNLANQRQNSLNAHLTKTELLKFCALTPVTIQSFEKLTQKLELSPRSYLRLLRVARTIADLANCPNVTLEHLCEALSYRKPFM